MRTGTGLLKTSVVKNDSRKILLSSTLAEELFGPLCRRILMELISLINIAELPRLLTREQTELHPKILANFSLRWLDFFFQMCATAGSSHVALN